MSGTEDQTPIQAVKCPNCGRENAPSRLFCQFCRHRIGASPQGDSDLNGQSAPSAEAQQLKASLQAAQGENQNLHQQLEAAREELEKAKAASAKPDPAPGIVEKFLAKSKTAVDTVAAPEPQSAILEEGSKSAEEAAGSVEEQVVLETRETETTFQRKSEVMPLASQSKARPDLDAKQVQGKPAGFDPGKTAALGAIKHPPVAGWVVILNGAQKGEDFRLHEGKNTVGKATGSDITLHDPAVSAMHASISYKDGKFVITDLDSTNGTFINNDSDPLARVELRDNDIIRVGETSLKFKCL
jgi:hypothetical protein